MTISSRTPEGEPHLCPICGEGFAVEPSFPGGDFCCHRCGQVLRRIRQYLGFAPEGIPPDGSRQKIELESLDVATLVMDLEEADDVEFPVDPAERQKLLGNLLRYL